MAPKGNQNALGNNGGAPRTLSPTPEECIKLGKELQKWALEEDVDDPHLTFSEWYSIEKFILREKWKALIKCPEFRPYYEQAQALLAKRCKNGTMEKSFGQRYIRLYDRDLTEEENETFAFKAELARRQKDDDEDDAIRKAAQYIAGIVKENSP